MDSQVIVYNLLKKSPGPAPIYVTVGNHDTYVCPVFSFPLYCTMGAHGRVDPIPDDTHI